MIIELGHLALIFAFALALMQMLVPLIGAHKGWRDWMILAEPAAYAQFAFIAVSFAALTYGFVASDFSLRLVVLNSHTDKPLLYKITGVWGNHEGSLLLWVLILALFGAAAAFYGDKLPMSLRSRVLAIQGAIGAAFLAFILFTSNPFLRLAQPPLNGEDLNPLLQDPGLAFHPPFLYLGYVGLSMAFSFAVAALLEGKVDAAWGRWVRPWTLAAWLFLTIGIGLGSWWAYYELGWGGFWFWDPVENASLMPWLIATALLHSAIVVEKREALKNWTVLLAILAFGFSLVGTFLVRSGIITSVHAFANDPERGAFILAILAVFMGGALTLYAVRAGRLEEKGVFSTASRESALVLNNVVLAVSCFVIFIGTLWPLIAEALTGDKVSVGPPFFNVVFTPFAVALAAILPIGAILPWKRAVLERAGRALWAPALLALAIGGLVWALQTGRSAGGPLGVALGVWLISGSLVDLAQRTGKSNTWRKRLVRLWHLPRADWGKSVAHGGLGILMIGVSGIMAWEQHTLQVMQIDGRLEIGDYEIVLEDVRRVEGPNYIATQARLHLYENGQDIGILAPEKRIYPVAGMPTSEAGIDNGFWRDVYAVIGDPQENGGWAVSIHIKPFANWIWGGSIIMALGGVLSLSDRRYRVAAGASRRQTKTVPAE